MAGKLEPYRRKRRFDATPEPEGRMDGGARARGCGRERAEGR